jgi:hypothetical protein
VVLSVPENSDNGADLNDKEEGKDLCNCQFSLIYDAMILLNTEEGKMPEQTWSLLEPVHSFELPVFMSLLSVLTRHSFSIG